MVRPRPTLFIARDGIDLRRVPGRSRPATATGTVVAMAALALSGCGASVNVSTKKTIDLDEVQTTIKQQYAAQGNALTDLDCKDGVEARTGAPIVCTGVNEQGSILDIRGSVTVAEGGRGRFRVRTVAANVKGTVIADRARALLEQKYGEKTRGLTCPERVPVPTKPTVTCELTTRNGLKYDTTLGLSATGDLDVQVADEAKNAPAG